MQEREINLVDLMVEILLRWRVFIVAMLVGAIALGVFGYARQWREVGEQEAGVEQAKQELEAMEAEEREAALEAAEQDAEDALEERLAEELTASQISTVEYTIRSEQLLEERLAYEEQSALMKINPDKVHKVSETFYLSSDSKEKTSSIVTIYEDMIRGTGLMDYVAERTGLTANNVTELISLMGRTSTMIQEKDSFTVSILHYSEAGCRQLLEAVTTFINEKKEELAEIFGVYEITALEPSFVTVKDQSYANYQRNYISETLAIQQSVEDNKDAFTFKQWQCYDTLLNGKVTDFSKEKIKELMEKEIEDAVGDTEDPEKAAEKEELEAVIESGVTATPGISVKYIVLGAVLAAFLYAFWIFAQYVFNTRIRATDNLQELYNLPQLGVIPGKSGRKKIFGRVDEMILKIRNRNKRRFSPEEAFELTKVTIKIAAAKEALTTLYLVGCDLKGDALEVCEQLKEGLVKDNIQVHILSNILYDAQALNEIENAKGAILVEKAGSTLYHEILQEKELLGRQGVHVLGGVIVG